MTGSVEQKAEDFMQELIDELRELAEDIPVPLEVPEHDQLVVAQEQILMPLPFDFIEFLLEATDIVYGTIEPVTISDPHSHTYLPEVTAMAWSLGMSRELVAVCESLGGYYCIDEGGEIRYWKDDEYSDETWENIWYWLRDVWMKSGE
jgi:hypothetical protein